MIRTPVTTDPDNFEDSLSPDGTLGLVDGIIAQRLCPVPEGAFSPLPIRNAGAKRQLLFDNDGQNIISFDSNQILHNFWGDLTINLPPHHWPPFSFWSYRL